MKDLVVDLRAVRRRLESASMAPAAKPAASSKRVYAIAAAAALALITGYVLVKPPQEEAPVAETKKIAVLPFENRGLPMKRILPTASRTRSEPASRALRARGHWPPELHPIQRYSENGRTNWRRTGSRLSARRHH